MSSSREFCPRCGDPISERQADAVDRSHDPDSVLCDECYLDTFSLVDAPDRIEVLVCAQCGAVHRGNRWVDVGAEDYTDVAIEETREALGVHVDAESISWQVAPEQIDQTTIRMHCEFSGVVREYPVHEEVTVPVKIGRQTCKRCGRIAGGSYASVVQVRAFDRTPTAEECDRAREIANEIVADMEDTGDRNAFVTEMNETDDGLDIKLSTTKIGKNIARRLTEECGGSFSSSETLITEDEEGNEVYRVTYSVRLPRYAPGEIVDLDDDEGPLLVRNVQGMLTGVRVTTGEQYEIEIDDDGAPAGRRLGTHEDAEETTVVTVEDERAIQVLDPETYEAKTIDRPSYVDADADTVPVLKSRAGLHVLPEQTGTGDA